MSYFLLSLLIIGSAHAAEPERTEVALFIEDLRPADSEPALWVPPNSRESERRHNNQLWYRLPLTNETAPTEGATPALQQRERITPRSIRARTQEYNDQRAREIRREYLRPVSPYDASDPVEYNPDEPSALQRDTDHIYGNISAPVSLVVYTDLECPFCQRHHPVMMSLVEEYGDDVNLIYRHFPLSIHPNAKNAAIASECAAQYGANTGFWEYIDSLLTKGVEPNRYEEYAVDAIIDGPTFRRCYEEKRFSEKIDASLKEGEALGITGTPTTFVVRKSDGKTRTIPGAQPKEAFELIIDELLQ